MHRRVVRKSPKAFDDLDAVALYLAEKVDAKLALRFLDSAEKTFRALATTPTLGPSCDPELSTLRKVRVWQVKGFPSYLVYYREIALGVEIIRVIHGARDQSSALDG